MNNIVNGNFKHYRRKGNRAKVLVHVLDSSFLGTGTISASFQGKGNWPSRKEV